MRLLLVLALAGLAFYYWNGHKTETGPGAIFSSSSPAPAPSPRGFIALPTLNNADSKQVVVFAPQNCPAEDAQRADAMARELTQRGIPSLRSHDVSFTSNDPDPAIGQRLNAVMSGQLPIVLINGRGKANPTLDEVIAEYMAMR